MQKWILFLAISLTPLCARSQQNSPPQPLGEGEKRLILQQLYDLEACRSQVAGYADFVSRDKALTDREQENWQRSLDLEKQATALAEKERDLAPDRAKTYEELYRSVVHRPAIGCRMKQLFTLGLARCH